MPWSTYFLGGAVFLLALLFAGYSYERFAVRRDVRGGEAPGRLVNVRGHLLHLISRGSGGPTVVIEQGVGEPSRLWRPMQERIAGFAQVCLYDRAGYAFSDAVIEERTVADRAEALHTLLWSGGIGGPYLLVAHSYGGLIVREFAGLYPEETAGLVLVDTPDEEALSEPDVQSFYARMRLFLKVMEGAAHVGLPRLLRQIPVLREGLFLVEPKEYAAAADDLASLTKLKRSSLSPGTLGELPLVVITHGQPFPGPFAFLERGWGAAQQRLAGLSRCSTLLVAEKSNHMVHLEEPDLVVEAIREMHQGLAAR